MRRSCILALIAVFVGALLPQVADCAAEQKCCTCGSDGAQSCCGGRDVRLPLAADAFLTAPTGGRCRCAWTPELPPATPKPVALKPTTRTESYAAVPVSAMSPAQPMLHPGELAPDVATASRAAPSQPSARSPPLA